MAYKIEEIRSEHDQDICRIIKHVGAEYGAVGKGFGPADEEVLCMSRYYSRNSNSIYLVATLDGQAVGGGGITAFNGSSDICELRKLFLLPENRGQGLGRELALRCLAHAQDMGYTQCYLDTLSGMKPAISLYEKLGFRHLQHPPNGTDHYGCDVWMIKELSNG